MEIKNIKQIQSLVKDGIKLYLIWPAISPGGKIQRDRVYEIVNCANYKYYFDVMTKPVSEFVLLRKSTRWQPGFQHGEENELKDEDVINTKARVFASNEDAKKALVDEVKALSYEAIKRVDYHLKTIERSRERLAKKEEKLLALKKQHYEMSVKRFSK